ncbi:hypothetical protein KGQ72_00555 [Patescibacteria group bacterium]|nr:hypothetical protein [Patescibacteria group bacterium]
MKSTAQDARNLLAKLIGEEGPATVLFIEFAARYGLPIKDGEVPLSTELNVMLQKWRVHLLDVTKAGFAGAIGFQRLSGKVACFGVWPSAPWGAREGYISVGDSFPLIEVLSGAFSQSINSRTEVLSTKIRFDRDDRECRTMRDEAVWSMVCEAITRANELGRQFERLECDYTDLLPAKG